MKLPAVVTGSALLALCAPAFAQDAQNALKPVSSFASISDPRQRAVALFAEAGRVLQHPRCLNCHPRGDQPFQGDAMLPHMPPVFRGGGKLGGRDGHGAAGMDCATCHGKKNFSASSSLGVPGNENWHLAPRSMAWEGASLQEICLQLKDPARNGGKTLSQIVEHNMHDSLVGWGWNPGVGRTPAPGTQKQFGELMQAWVDAGAHCP